MTFPDDVKGKTVAIVGRAGSIMGTGHGAAIDSADIVIRINWLLPIPEDQAADVGTRTDLVYHCKRARTAKKNARDAGVATYRVSGKRRKREAKRHFKRGRIFRPTTGMVCILETLRAGPHEIRLYGFDFFRSGHVQERMPETDDYSKPLKWDHNPEEERRALKRIICRNPSIIPDRVLKEALR
jgi:hypothetical protein